MFLPYLLFVTRIPMKDEIIYDIHGMIKAVIQVPDEPEVVTPEVKQPEVKAKKKGR